MLIPITARSTEQFLLEFRALCAKARSRSARANGEPWATVIVPAARKGIMTGMISWASRAISGETAPPALHQPRQRVLEYGPGSAHRRASCYDLHAREPRPTDDWHRQAWAAGLVLLGLVLVANITARMIISRGVSLPK